MERYCSRFWYGPHVEHDDPWEWGANCVRWERLPAEVRAATDSYKAESDPLCDFFTECCVLADDCWTKTVVLQSGYEAFCRERGDELVEGRTFTKSLKKRGCTPARKNTGRGWQGIGVLHDGESQTTNTASEQLF